MFPIHLLNQHHPRHHDQTTITNDNTIGGMSAASFGHSHFYNLNSPNAVSHLAWRCLKGSRRKKKDFVSSSETIFGVKSIHLCNKSAHEDAP